MTKSNPALCVEGLFKKRGGKSVLQGASLTIAPGGACALVGENGAGKSTLLSIVAGVLEPDRGEVWIAGQSLSKSRVEALRNIGFAPERAQLPEGIAVIEWLDLLAALKQQPLPSPEELEEYRIQPILGQRLDSLSLGQLRRVLLRGALLGNPALLILDEPSNGLDEETRNWMLSALTSHLRSSGSLLLATHDQAFAESLSARVAQLRNGVIQREAVVAHSSARGKEVPAPTLAKATAASHPVSALSSGSVLDTPRPR